MSSSSKSRVAYIEPSTLDGKPCMSLSQLASDVANEARLHNMLTHYVGINSRAGAGRRKVKITITVEDAA